ncbi:MAG TPA: DUF5666 domain-containing protein [Thermoanaerobaculia bacterium]|nr:DUF5666 domain-containing protein [Thermoanaerobaculia bacterium]
MRKAFLSVGITLVIISLATGCNRGGETPVTGLPSGSRALAGEVVTVGDLSGASPAGISVSSNGQIAVTDGAGRFAFNSLPESNVQLTFSRADGINASTVVGASAAAVVVQLQKAKAAVVATRKPGGGGQTRELEGLILEISDSEITVENASTHGPVTAKITDSTVIRWGGTTLEASDLKEGDRVHVKTTANSDGTLTADEIRLQHRDPDDGDDGGDDDGGQLKELEGLILEVSASSITVNNASTGGPVTAAITEDTVIVRGNTRLTVDDLEAGDRVHVKTNGDEDALEALQIRLQNPA